MRGEEPKMFISGEEENWRWRRTQPRNLLNSPTAAKSLFFKEIYVPNNEKKRKPEEKKGEA